MSIIRTTHTNFNFLILIFHDQSTTAKLHQRIDDLEKESGENAARFDAILKSLDRLVVAVSGDPQNVVMMPAFTTFDLMASYKFKAFARNFRAQVNVKNAGDKLYTPMVGSLKGAAYQATCELVFKGEEQPSGYTEPLLHAWHVTVKAGA